MTPRPVTTCGLPGPKRHRPHCTGRWRLIEGCWCAIDMGPTQDRKLTARQWRAARRKHAAKQRAYRREDPVYYAMDDEWVRDALLFRARQRAALEYAVRRRIQALDRLYLRGHEAA